MAMALNQLTVKAAAAARNTGAVAPAGLSQ